MNWRKIINSPIGVLLAVLLLFAGFKLYQAYQRQESEEQMRSFISAPPHDAAMEQPQTKSLHELLPGMPGTATP